MLSQQTHVNWLDRSDASEVNRFGSTDMHVAAAQGDVLTLHTMLAGGRDPNVQNSRGFTPLHTAVVSGQLECVEMLIAHDSSPFVTDSMGHTVLDKISIVLGYQDSFSQEMVSQYHEIHACLKRLAFKSLSHLCRDKILSSLVSLDESVIRSLPVPSKLHSFLQYKVSEEIQSELYVSSLFRTRSRSLYSRKKQSDKRKKEMHSSKLVAGYQMSAKHSSLQSRQKHDLNPN